MHMNKKYRRYATLIGLPVADRGLTTNVGSTNILRLKHHLQNVCFPGIIQNKSQSNSFSMKEKLTFAGNCQNMDLEQICSRIVPLIRETGLYQKEENNKLSQSGIEKKGKNDYVTYVDKESERRLVECLSKIIPEAGFLTEESYTAIPEEEYFWVVDPLDGTSNYIHHLSPYAISVGLMKSKEVLLGCIYEVTRDEAFYAWKGGKTWLNGRPVTVSETPTVENSMIGHGIPYKLEKKYDYLRDCIPSFYGKCTLRHLGSAAAEMAYVAAGRIDAYFHDNLSPWDVAAGDIIVREAGGNVSGFTNDKDPIFGKELIATNGRIHQELTDWIKQYND